MMTEQEFCALMVGKPWVKNACCFDAADCWGLVVLYYRHVIGIEIPEDHGDFAQGYSRHVKDWRRIDTKGAGVVFTMFRGQTPTHCGIVLQNGMALHSSGNEERGGSVQINSIRAIEKLYGRCEFYAYSLQ